MPSKLTKAILASISTTCFLLAALVFLFFTEEKVLAVALLILTVTLSVKLRYFWKDFSESKNQNEEFSELW